MITELRNYLTSANPFGVEVISKVLGDAGVRFEMTPFQMLGVIHVPGVKR